MADLVKHERSDAGRPLDEFVEYWGGGLRRHFPRSNGSRSCEGRQSGDRCPVLWATIVASAAAAAACRIASCIDISAMFAALSIEARTAAGMRIRT
jgi:hypothetical protein